MTAYKNLRVQSLYIADQMDKVEDHLESILKSLEEIEDRFRKGQKAQDKLVKQQKLIPAQRLKERAEDLIEACNEYLNLTARKWDDPKQLKSN